MTLTPFKVHELRAVFEDTASLKPLEREADLVRRAF